MSGWELKTCQPAVLEPGSFWLNISSLIKRRKTPLDTACVGQHEKIKKLMRLALAAMAFLRFLCFQLSDQLFQRRLLVGRRQVSGQPGLS